MQEKRELRSLAAILPRYGADLGGGAETLIREMILQIRAKSFPRDLCPILSGVERIEVWTTCARDHRTWENFHRPGVTEEDGIPVHRFSVDERDLEIFIGREIDIASGRTLHPNEQLDWLGAGVNSKALYSHIAKAGADFDALLFGPYLFPTTFWGGLIHPEKTLLLPCLHNEAYAYQAVFSAMFHQARGVICNAAAEARLVCDIYGQGEMEGKTTVVGMGFVEHPTEGGNAGLPAAIAEVLSRSYLLYSGRKEEGKNLHRLIEWFGPLRKKYPDLELVLMGSGEIQFLKELPSGVTDLGFVSNEEKRRLMAGAMVLCQPSVNESFSIVLMEAWLEHTPVLVHGDCPVTREHAVSAQGGLFFSNAEEFYLVVDTLMQDPSLLETLGENGYRYVREVYSWDAVMKRLEDAVGRVGYVECGASDVDAGIARKQMEAPDLQDGARG